MKPALSHHRYIYHKYTDLRRLKKSRLWSYNKLNAEGAKLIHKVDSGYSG